MAQSLSLEETSDAITVKDEGQIVLTYNKISPAAPAGIDKVFERSGCLHPVCSPLGRTVTAMFPADHAHQHGIFSAWVNTTYKGQKVDFWNLAGGTGRVLHDRVVSQRQGDGFVVFEAELIHRSLTVPPVDVLRERWKVTVYATGETHRQFDLETTQSALTNTPLLVNKYHYGGIALRGPMRWLTERDGYARNHPDLAREPSAFLNDLGSDRVTGNHQHAKWVALSGEEKGQPVSIAMLCHAENFRAPQAARLHPTKPYGCFAPCIDSSFTIDRKHPFTSKYRFLVTDTQPNPKWIQQQWDAWCGK